MHILLAVKCEGIVRQRNVLNCRVRAFCKQPCWFSHVPHAESVIYIYIAGTNSSSLLSHQNNSSSNSGLAASNCPFLLPYSCLPLTEDFHEEATLAASHRKHKNESTQAVQSWYNPISNCSDSHLKTSAAMMLPSIYKDGPFSHKFCSHVIPLLFMDGARAKRSGMTGYWQRRKIKAIHIKLNEKTMNLDSGLQLPTV